MEHKVYASLVDEVEKTLKHFQQPDLLKCDTARDWPAVQELTNGGLDIISAVRRIVKQAVQALETNNPGDASLLRARYLEGQSIVGLAGDRTLDPSTLHRQRTRAIAELVVVIAKANRESERRARVRRFLPRHPVVGFDALASDIVAQLHEHPAPDVVLLEGMGGLGKTTLAGCVAAQCVLSDAFAGVLWTSAKQVEFDLWGGERRVVQPRPFNVDNLLHDLAQELGITAPSGAAALREEVRAHCKRGQYLIVIDNLETIADMLALAPLIDMLVGPSRVLVTTRDRVPTALPATMPRRHVLLAELDAATSYRVLREAAAYVGARALEGAGDDELAQIYSVTGGNPLALWLVAGQARILPWSTFVQDLVEHHPSGSKGYELYDYLYRRSWEQLDRNARLVLFAMHRFEAGASYEQLFALSRLERGAFHQAIEELGKRMLLIFNGRYYIHRLTYTFLRVVIAGWWT